MRVPKPPDFNHEPKDAKQIVDAHLAAAAMRGPDPPIVQLPGGGTALAIVDLTSTTKVQQFGPLDPKRIYRIVNKMGDMIHCRAFGMTGTGGIVFAKGEHLPFFVMNWEDRQIVPCPMLYLAGEQIECIDIKECDLALPTPQIQLVQ